MAGYEFGSVIKLDSFITLIAFLGVIVFILFFDMMIEIMEYFLEGTKLYHNMIQMIYKELMLMGLVSFTIVMITATQRTQHIDNPTVTEWILSVDYSHILLFFLTFFFVIHAFYLMRKAILSGMDYRRSAKRKLPDLIDDMKKMQETKPLETFLFQFQYLPLSELRDHIEFYLLQALFRDTYWLPEDFHFSEYLSNCFNRHALKTVNRSWITWVTLMIFAVLNYARVQLHIGFGSCKDDSYHGEAYNSTITHHDDHYSGATDTGGGTDSTGGTTDTGTGSSTTVHFLETIVSRMLSAATTSSSSTEEELSSTCRYNYVKLFLSSAVVLCGYTFMIVIISRLYKIRMLHRIGLQSPHDYLAFLEFTKEEEDRKAKKTALEKKLGKAKTSALQEEDDEPVRITNELLKQDIERVLDADEHGHHEEAEFRVIAELLAHTFNTTKEWIQMMILSMRITFNRGCSWLYEKWVMRSTGSGIGGMSGKSSVENGSIMSAENDSGGGNDPITTPRKKGALKKTQSILRKEILEDDIDSRETSFHNHQNEKKEFMGKLVQPQKRKWSVMKNNSTAPEPPLHVETHLSAITEGPSFQGSNRSQSQANSSMMSTEASLPRQYGHDDHHASSSGDNKSKQPTDGEQQRSVRSRRRSVIELIHNLDLPDVDKERNLIFTAAHTATHHGIGNSLRVAQQHAIHAHHDTHQQHGGEAEKANHISPATTTTTTTTTHPDHPNHAHGHHHHLGVSIRRTASQDEEPKSVRSGRTAAKNTVVVHAPENGYSTVEKFLKKQNEEHHLMMQQMQEQQGHHNPQQSNGIFGQTMRHVGDAMSVRGAASSIRKSHGNAMSIRMKAVSVRKIPIVQKPPQQQPPHDLEAGTAPANSSSSTSPISPHTTPDEAPVEEEEDEEEVRLNADFSDIYFFGSATYFHRAVELCILFNCLYMAFWTTDFIAITSHIEQSVLWRWLDQLAMIIPVVLVLPCIGYIAETCSLLNAIAKLNLEVVYEVLEDWEDTNRILSDLRKKIMSRIAILESAMEDKVQIIHELFEEIDQDGSGRIDKIEFRFLLRTLKLTYSDDRFNRLFRAVDATGEGSIGWEEMYQLLFPDEAASMSSSVISATTASPIKGSTASHNSSMNEDSHPNHHHNHNHGYGHNSHNSCIPPPITIHSDSALPPAEEKTISPRLTSSSRRAPAAPHVETVPEVEDFEDEDGGSGGIQRESNLKASSKQVAEPVADSLSHVAYSDTDSDAEKQSTLS